MITVLYVDDEPALLELGKLFLEETGDFSVTTAESAGAALDLLAAKHFDAIISDYQMPETDGLELLKQVRYLYGDIPFILFTGRGREEVVILALNLGVDFYLQKGGDPKSQYAELTHKVWQATSKKQTEQALIQSQGYLDQIFSSVKAGIMVVDGATHDIVDINPAGAEMIGLPKEEILGKICHKFICPAQEGQCPITDLKKNIDNSERVLISNEGKVVPIIKFVTQINFEGRDCLLETFFDISSRKQVEEELLRKNEALNATYEEMAATEEELRYQYDKLVIGEQNLKESEEKFRALVEQSLDGTIITDFSGTIRFVNPRIGEILGHERVWDLVGTSNVFEFIIPEYQNRAFQDMANVISGHDSYMVEYKILTMDKKEIWIECIGKKITYGGMPSLILSVHEITDAKQTKEALHMANAKLQLLSSVTRHDILNQVLVVNSYCSLTEKIVPDNLKALEYLSQIMKASENIQKSISFTKDYEELGLNAPVWQDIEKIAKMAAADLVTEKIRFVVNTGNTEIFADPMLMLVFYNLFENANYHGGHVSEIAIHFTEQEKAGTLIIKDNGTGIPDHLKERIFERGFGKNSGFGLFLIREILAITGLSITETGKKGNGACFEIFLPPGTWRRGPG